MSHLQAAHGTLDGILNTVPVSHNLSELLMLMKVDRTMACVGVPPEAPPVPLTTLIVRRQTIAGCLFGGIKETQDMLDYCAEKGISCDVEVIPVQEVNTAFERLIKGDVRYR